MCSSDLSWDPKVYKDDNAQNLSKNYAFAHMQLAQAYRRANDFPHAVAEMERVSRMFPDWVEIQMPLGGIYLAAGDSAKAWAFYDGLVQRVPGSAEAHYYRGASLGFRGRPAEAVRQQLESQRWATNQAVVAEKVARMYWTGIRVRRALDWYETALALTNATPMQRRRLLLDSVEVHRVIGQPAGAYRCLEELITTAPPDVDSQELRIRQLQFAREMKDLPKITIVSNEIRRLGARP